MAIDRLPDDYADAAQLFDNYEDRHVAPSPEGPLIGDRMIFALNQASPARSRSLG